LSSDLAERGEASNQGTARGHQQNEQRQQVPPEGRKVLRRNNLTPLTQTGQQRPKCPGPQFRRPETGRRKDLPTAKPQAFSQGVPRRTMKCVMPTLSLELIVTIEKVKCCVCRTAVQQPRPPAKCSRGQNQVMEPTTQGG
jgi:hypothetical protein